MKYEGGTFLLHGSYKDTNLDSQIYPGPRYIYGFAGQYKSCVHLKSEEVDEGPRQLPGQSGEKVDKLVDF